MYNPIVNAMNAYLKIFYNIPTPVRTLVGVSVLLFAIIAIIGILNRLR